MFPPAKKKPPTPGGPPDPFAPQAGAAPPPGPPDPFGGPPPGGDPFGGGAQPPLGMQPGIPPPGGGMDPMQAMLGGIGSDPRMTGGVPQSQGPPMGPDGFPVGGSMPPMGPDGDDPDMGGSDLLAALSGAMGGSGPGGNPNDPYAVGPMDPLRAFQGIGQGDPNMGQQQMLQMLALAKMGVGGPGGSGADPGGGQIGSMLGM